MDWKVFMATFSAIFMAELADKTQLVGALMSAKTSKPLTVFFGSICGYAVVTIISVIIGNLLGNYLGGNIIKYIGGFLFIIIGVLMLAGKL